MLTQLIYRSRSHHRFTAEELSHMLSELTARNKERQVSGLLLFDGEFFLQVLEGEDQTVDALYAALCRDERHTDIVLLLRDPIPHTHFDDFRIGILDAPEVQGLSIRERVAYWGAALGLTWNRDYRSARIVEAFVRGRWRDAAPALAWLPESEGSVMAGTSATVPTSSTASMLSRHARFALQPIVHTRSHRITSVEALLRGPQGEPPQVVLGSLAPDKLHEFDLYSKGDAIALAAALKLDCTLSVNLLPMSLVANNQAVDFLLQQCRQHGWPHEKLLVEVTEEEAITHFDEFLSTVQKLRAAGIQVAVDDFGAGHAGLSLLADFQPDKLKLDKRIIQGVHASGPRQAIVRSVVEFCFCLGITVVAEGVETVEDWHWLQSAGVRRFQGFLFARPSLQGMSPIIWPAPRESSAHRQLELH